MTRTDVQQNFIRAGDFDERTARLALASANLNAVRLALYQLTRDAELAAMTVERRVARGGSISLLVLNKADRLRVIEKAIDYLSRPAAKQPQAPHPTEVAGLFKMFGGSVKTPSTLRLALEEAGFASEYPQPPAGRAIPNEKLSKYKVIVIGAGISGLAAGRRLKQLGLPFEILERQAGIGGTWFLNDYPEARVDISNFIYQFRFERNFPWTNHYATQNEIRRYLEHIADKYELREHIKLNTTVTSARWDEAESGWDLKLNGPGAGCSRVCANFLISASGLFSTPNIPKFPGLETFEGKVFHSTNWDHKFDFDAQRVALIGAGSSGVQMMPWIASRAKHLSVFQRTPNWITPIDDYRRPVKPEQQWLFDSLPFYWNWFCYSMSVVEKQTEALQCEDPGWSATAGGFNEQNDKLRTFLEDYIRQKLAGHPNLIAKCTPSYPPLARRLVVDSGWYDALLRPNVDLVTEPIAEVGSDWIRTADSMRWDVDAIVLGTGFRASDFLCSVDYTGRDGIRLQELWRKDGARAYLGMLLPEFPNFFVFYGPNGQPQTGSFHDWADRWAGFTVARISDVIERNARSIKIRQSAFEAYNAELDGAMARMVWGRDDAAGYYINEHGRAITKLPWKADEFLQRLAQPDPNVFEIK